MSWRRIGVLAAALAGFGGGLMLPASPAAAANNAAVADSWVDAASPGQNNGGQPYVRVDGSPLRRAFLRFNVQGLSGPTPAVLKFFAESGSHAGVEVHTVADTTWGESTITYANQPALGPVVGATGSFPSGTWLSVNLTGVITGNGLYSFALTTPDDTAVKITSREGANAPVLIAPPPPSPSPYVVSRVGSTYQAVSQVTGATFSGSLKFVGESAVADLAATGGGTIRFTAGTFDFGTEFFKFFNLRNVVFEGAGMDATIVRNSSSAAADTEPFNFTGADAVTVRDLTVWAGGSIRTTSDALDFDRGNDVVVERVRIAASRGRGIVFDGKNDDWTALRNTVRDCVISGLPSDGIEILASSENTVTGCAISDVGGHGIQLVKSSTTADQPNKKSNDNVVSGNTIDQAGQDGINVSSGDRNRITGNTITNSSDDTSGRSGVRIVSLDAVSCDDNVVSGNTATDNQAPKTQKYGLDIASAQCNRTVVGPGNNFAGNLLAEVRNAGTGTVFV
jgi:parallel beta-helix repeat protein